MLSSDEPGEPIFAIAAGAGWMHVYSTVDSLLATRDMDSGPPDAVEFFDIRGRRLAAVFDQSWQLTGLRLSGAQADETTVRDQLTTVVERLRESIDDRLAKSGTTEITREDAMRVLPNLSSKSLTECYALLKTVFGDGPAGEAGLTGDGSFWHNFFCHCC